MLMTDPEREKNGNEFRGEERPEGRERGKSGRSKSCQSGPLPGPPVLELGWLRRARKWRSSVLSIEEFWGCDEEQKMPFTGAGEDSFYNMGQPIAHSQRGRLLPFDLEPPPVMDAVQKSSTLPPLALPLVCRVFMRLRSARHATSHHTGSRQVGR